MVVWAVVQEWFSICLVAGIVAELLVTLFSLIQCHSSIVQLPTDAPGKAVGDVQVLCPYPLCGFHEILLFLAQPALDLAIFGVTYQMKDLFPVVESLVSLLFTFLSSSPLLFQTVCRESSTSAHSQSLDAEFQNEIQDLCNLTYLLFCNI